MTKRKTSAIRQKESRTGRRYQDNDSKTYYMKESKTIDFTQAQPKKQTKPLELVPQSINQEKYIIALTDSDTDIDGGVVSSNVHDEKSGFEVGRRTNGSSKIDYATTIEDAYDQLNQILGSDGVKSLTTDTQKLMQQQMELAKSMEAMTPLIKGIMPMAEKAQEMMKSMDNGSGGLGSVMEIAKKMSGGLGGVTKTS